MISAAGFRLKGGGWYETDFKTGSKKNVAATGDQSSSGSKSK
jgi:predicted nucleic acid-binding Zn ribbon protein